VWPFSKVLTPSSSPVLSAETLEAGILATKGEGVHMAVLYATMLGFQHEVLRTQEAISEFLKLAQSAPDFTSEGISRAVSRIVSDADVMCSGQSFETYV
jgi:hypothetical protein